MSNNPQHFIRLFGRLKVLIIGEAMLDSYLEGDSNRLCREAPVPVVAVGRRTDQPGGAANTAVNLAALGANVNFLSVIGGDPEGVILTRCLEKNGVSTSNLLVDPDRGTLAKNRVIASGQMLVRFDQGSDDAVTGEIEQNLLDRLTALYPEVDAVIISDYGYGILTPRSIETIQKLQARYNKVLVVDAKDLPAYREVGVTAVKPNFAEALALLKLKDLAGQSRADFLAKNRERFLKLTGAQIAAVTMDTEGAFIFERGQPSYRTYARPNPNSRAAGAGDTFVSVLALALAAGAPTTAAAELASGAAAVVVGKEGTSTCSADELQEHFVGDRKYCSSPARLEARLESLRQAGKQVVFTNGCFDILHPGHINFLNQAKELGDILVVAVNSDASVEQLKGPGRPINRLEDRLQVLGALSCVDFLVSFDEPSPEELITLLKPEVVAKGGNYTREKLPEAALIEEQGGQLHFLPYLDESSTSHLLERIREALEITLQTGPDATLSPLNKLAAENVNSKTYYRGRA